MSDSDDRWTVRGVPRSYRDAAADAADKLRITQGQWLCAAIDLKIQRDREPIGDLLPRVSDYTSDPVAHLEWTTRIINAAATLAAARRVPVVLRQRAYAVLIRSLPPADGEHTPKWLERQRPPEGDPPGGS